MRHPKATITNLRILAEHLQANGVPADFIEDTGDIEGNCYSAPQRAYGLHTGHSRFIFDKMMNTAVNAWKLNLPEFVY